MVAALSLAGLGAVAFLASRFHGTVRQYWLSSQSVSFRLSSRKSLFAQETSERDALGFCGLFHNSFVQRNYKKNPLGSPTLAKAGAGGHKRPGCTARPIEHVPQKYLRKGLARN